MADTFLDATAQAELVRTGEASPLELVDDAINRIEKLNGELNAVIHPLFDSARADARGASCPTARSAACRSLQGPVRRRSRATRIHEGMQFLKRRATTAPTTPTRSRSATSTRASCASAARTRPSSGSCRRPSPRRTGRRATRGTRRARPGGSSGGSAAAVASGMVAGRARQRRRRLDPHPRELLRARRAEAVAGPHVARARLQRRSTTCSSPSCACTRTVRDTAAVSRRVAGRRDRRHRARRRRPCVPYREEVGADPGQAAHRRCSPTTRSRPARSTPTASPRRATRRGCSSRSATPSRRRSRRASSSPSSSGTSPRCGPATLVYNLRYWERKVGREITARRRRAAHVDAGRDGSGDHRRPTTSTRSTRSLELGRDVEEWFASGYDLLLTPTLGEPPCRARRRSTRPTSRCSGSCAPPTFVPYTPLANMTGKPAISLPLHVERRRPADRLAAHGRVRPRRPARSASPSQLEAGAAVGRPPAARPRLIATVATVTRRGRAGLLRRHADGGRRAARRRRRLPLPRGARRADARDPAEGPPDATRRAGTRATSPRTSPARCRSSPTAARRSSPTRAASTRPRPRAPRSRPRARWASPASRSRRSLGDDLLGRLDALHADTARRSRISTPASRSTTLPGAAAVRGRVPRRAADRRRARAGRRHRHHRAGRRRVAVPRAARVRARLGVGRLGPPRGRHPRRPPARVLGPEPRRQLLRRLVGAAPSLGPAVPDRHGRRRRHRGDLEARRVGRPGRAPTRCAISCSTRCTTRRVTSRPTSSPTSRRRSSRTSPTTACASPACAARPRPTRTSCCSRTHAGWAGEARVAFSWPDAYEKAKATAAILAQAGRDGRPRRRRSGASSTGASTRSAARRCRRADGGPPRTARVRAARRVALRRPAHRGARRPRARPAHAVGAARRA